MKKLNRYSKNVLVVAITSLVSSGIAVADGLGLEEVVVTAQKRAESMQDIPVSVSAMSGADLEGLKLSTGSEIAAQVPNMQIQSPYGDSQPVISVRGVSMSDYSHNQSSPVAMYVDETYKSVGALQALQLFDVERIEVLRGPQGTLYGKNATGGAVNFITKTPGFEQNGYLTLGFGNYNRREARGAIQTALIDDTLAVRGAFVSTRNDGYVQNKFPGGRDQSETDDWAARLSFLYTPRDDLEAIFRVHKSRSTGVNSGMIAANIVPSGVGFAGYTREGLDFFENESDREVEKELENTGASLTLNWELNDTLTLTSITAYDEGLWDSPEEDDGSPLNIDHNDYYSEVSQLTQELRVSSAYSGPFNWIAGLYWGEEEVYSSTHYRFYNEFPDVSLNLLNEFTQTRTSHSAYWHSTYDLTEALSLTFGVRYTQDKTDIDDFRAFAGGIDSISRVEVLSPSLPLSGGVMPTISFTDRDWSGKVGLDWRVTEDIMIYGSYSQGYRSGAFNGQAFFDTSELTPVDPEHLDAWEVGLKSQWFDNRLQLNGAAFYYDYTDQQFLNVTPTLLQLLVNADKSVIKGFELELVARPIEALSLQAGIGYLDSEYEKLELSGQDLSGNELLSAPELNFNAAIDWEVVQTKWGTLVAHVDTVYTDDQYFDAFNNDRVSQDDYWVTNARLSFESSDDRYTLALWVKNIEEKEYYVYGLDIQGAVGFDYMQRGQPRTFGAEATVRF